MVPYTEKNVRKLLEHPFGNIEDEVAICKAVNATKCVVCGRPLKWKLDVGCDGTSVSAVCCEMDYGISPVWALKDMSNYTKVADLPVRSTCKIEEAVVVRKMRRVGNLLY